jgi:hypothetical protein
MVKHKKLVVRPQEISGCAAWSDAPDLGCEYRSRAEVQRAVLSNRLNGLPAVRTLSSE